MHKFTTNLICYNKELDVQKQLKTSPAGKHKKPYFLKMKYMVIYS